MAIPYFPFYPNDWRSDPKVAMLSLEQRGAYLEVMCLMWVLGDNDGRIPDDDQLIVRQIHLHMTKWRRIKKALTEGPNAVLTIEDGFIYQKRLQKERRKAGEKSEVNRKNIEARWAKNDGSEREPAYERNTSEVRSKYQSESEPDIVTPLTPLAGGTDTQAKKTRRRNPVESGTRIPDGWMPSKETVNAMRQEIPGVTSDDLRKATREFVDYWKGVPGAKGYKLDWDAVWRNRIRDQEKHQKLRLSSDAKDTAGSAVWTGLRILQ